MEKEEFVIYVVKGLVFTEFSCFFFPCLGIMLLRVFMELK